MKFEDSAGNSVEIDYADEVIVPDISQGVKTKAGGAMATQISGERIVLKCKARATVAEYRALMELLKNGSRRYYYTPEETYTLYSSTIEIPFSAVMTSLQSSWDNRNVHYITYTITSTDLV